MGKSPAEAAGKRSGAGKGSLKQKDGSRPSPVQTEDANVDHAAERQASRARSNASRGSELLAWTLIACAGSAQPVWTCALPRHRRHAWGARAWSTRIAHHLPKTPEPTARRSTSAPEGRAVPGRKSPLCVPPTI